MLSQKFVVTPSGIIHEGFLNYWFNPASGEFTFKGEVVAKKFFFTKTIPLEGLEKIDPKLLKSAGRKVGQVINFPPLSLKIEEINGHFAHCSVVLDSTKQRSMIRSLVPSFVNFKAMSVGDFSATGMAVIDLSKEFISIKKIEATGNALGFDIHLLVNEA